MRQKLFLAVAVCLACLLTAKAQTVVESESTLTFTETAARLALAIDNPKPAFDGRIELELLDAEDKVRAATTQNRRLESGKKSYDLELPIGDLMKTNNDELLWFRLRYRVGDARGTVSLSQLARDIFELRVIASELLLSGMNYRSRIRALNVLTGQPVGGVRIDAELDLDLLGAKTEKLELRAAGETDPEGFATLDFQIPVDAKYDGDGEIRITGRKNGLIREAGEDLQTPENDYSFLMLTDKPIYQPEQLLNVRGILFKGGEGKTVMPAREVEFRIEDADETVLYREKVKTSAFGVAAVSWKIPENAKLGDYRIRVRCLEQEENFYAGYQKVKISRYELPNFAVRAKAVKPYYLPNEKSAEIEVAADYLFGKPVAKGKVRVARENSREWNWKEQKYEIDEGEAHEGETDAGGKFTARFDLSEDHKELAEDGSDKFEDLHFTAYFTDLTTNKTEQRRFDVRVTREPIHVYLIGAKDDNNPRLPVTAYVSAFYADGRPAVCDVELKGREEDGDDEKYRTLLRTKTNSFGAGKLRFKRPKFEDEDADLEFQLIARDRNGLKGTLGVGEDNEEEIDFDADEDVLQLSLEKTVFKPGEAVGIELASNRQTGVVYVDVVQGLSVIESRFVNLAGGRAALKIPYRPEFKGQLTLAAYLENEDDELVRTARGIIFPAQTNLRLETSFDKEYYKPGEKAKVGFGVLDAVGQAVESSLGVVVFDKAIEERARTDADFGGMFGGDYAGWLGFGDSFGGVNVKDLNALDPAKPISAEMQLVAEVMFSDEYYYPNVFHSRSYAADAKSVYAAAFKKQFEPIEKALAKHFDERASEHPVDDASLQKILRERGFESETLRDPWGQKYRAVFETEKSLDVLRFVTAGADKIFDTRDDFTVSSASFAYFTPTGKAIDGALLNYYASTGKFIRDERTLFRELGVSELKDRFGRPYQIGFEVDGKKFVTRIRSLGKDGAASKYSWADDFDVWTNRLDYFVDIELRILKILRAAKKFPMDENEFKSVLRTGGVDFDALRDGYGEKVYLTKKLDARYADRAVVEKVKKYGEQAQTERIVVKPVTQTVVTFYIRGNGADKKENTYDDTTFAEFSHVVSEQTKDDAQPKPMTIKPVTFVDGTGSIGGVVTDAVGAALAGAIVTATNQESGAAQSTTSNDDGNYLIADLAAGIYSVKVEAPGFKVTVAESVQVVVNKTTRLDFVVEAGSVSEVVTVDVGATDQPLDTTSSNVSTSLNAQKIELLPKGVDFLSVLKVVPGIRAEQVKGGFSVDGASGKEDVFVIDGKEYVKTPEGKLVPFSGKSTPKLREYFPETLFWSPELLTDKDGRAALNFKMADNITTWKLYTIASTRQGKIGVAEKEITVFQPFFVDLDPPKFLTDGDEIHLPAQVRNYTAEKQKVDVTMARADWFSLLSPDRQSVEVESSAAANAVFGFKAVAPIKDGRQRVTAVAAKDSDAIEKPVTVRPNGQEIVRSESKLFAGSAAFDLDFPENALARTPRAELKIYPNPLAHVAEAVEGLLKRPYGCGEQTISSTYPNLMILKFKPEPENSAVRQKAKKYLQKGYERLLGYQTADGGFSYWGGKDSSDVALTAYALRFMADARGFVEIDEKVVEAARQYLIKQQRADGSFTKRYAWETVDDPRRAKLLTSYVARTLAMLKTEKSVMDKALGYLTTRSAEIDDPYTLALLGLAALDAGNAETAREIAGRLEKTARAEGDRIYWNLETNTPFYGWGTAGRIETTALALQLLIKTNDRNPKTGELIAKATMFLLQSKDRFGVWHSTQTTVNVLDALLMSLAPGKARTITVSLNGEKFREIDVAADRIEPLVLDLSEKLSGASRLEIASSDEASVMSQLVKTHYIDWRDAEISNRDVNDSRAIRLDYKCDRQQAKIMETVTCAVAAERVGFQGYGMLLAEIGLPPGADVSRESLEKAFAADWSLSRYDVLPDRIVVYLWARAGGSRFNFSFKPRYGINAATPASTVYDYYNEESKGIVAPLRFDVR